MSFFLFHGSCCTESGVSSDQDAFEAILSDIWGDCSARHSRRTKAGDATTYLPQELQESERWQAEVNKPSRRVGGGRLGNDVKAEPGRTDLCGIYASDRFLGQR